MNSDESTSVKEGNGLFINQYYVFGRLGGYSALSAVVCACFAKQRLSAAEEVAKYDDIPRCLSVLSTWPVCEGNLGARH